MVPELETYRTSLQIAWVSKGEHFTDSIYEGQQSGLVKCMNTIYKGVRSTSVCFLDGKPNIKIIPETFVRKIMTKDGSAVGIEATDKHDKPFTLTAKREVVLFAGVFESSQLLPVTDIGPKNQLASFGIERVLDSPHVGQNPIIVSVYMGSRTSESLMHQVFHVYQTAGFRTLCTWLLKRVCSLVTRQLIVRKQCFNTLQSPLFSSRHLLLSWYTFSGKRH